MKIPASSTKDKKCAAAHRLPVSQKFYNEISARIRSSFASVSPSDALAESAICCVESYLREGLLPSGAVVESVRLMFALLRPEIDKAMARSAAARRRRRKPQTDATVTGGAENEPSSESISDAIPESVREMAGSDYDPENLQIFSKPFRAPLMKTRRMKTMRRPEMPLRPSCSTAASVAVRSAFSVGMPAGWQRDDEKNIGSAGLYIRGKSLLLR